MARRRGEPESSDEEGPESLSLTQSKQRAHHRETELKKAELLLKERKRGENRERDRKLKERAEKNKRTHREKSGGSKGLDLEARMQRAMREAQDENGDDESESDRDEQGLVGIDGAEDLDDDDDSGEGSSNQEEGVGLEAVENDVESIPDGSDEELEKQPPRTPNPDHLPDELFEAAFKASTAPSKRKAEEMDSKKQHSRKRKRSNVPPKDLIIGSRAIRILPVVTKPSNPSMLPSRKIKKFLDRTLALKGGNPKARGWERRPANIGVMRRNGGPAANFVRD